MSSKKKPRFSPPFDSRRACNHFRARRFCSSSPFAYSAPTSTVCQNAQNKFVSYRQRMNRWWCCLRFTNVPYVLAACAWWWSAEFLVSVAKSLLWGVAVSFSMVPAFDSTVYRRMRAENGWGVGLFWSGNVLLHFVPLWIVRDVPVGGAACLAAVAIHASWAYVVSRGTWSLSALYVDLPVGVWKALLLCSWLTECLVGDGLLSPRV